MNSARYNTDCNGKVRWDEDGDGAGDGGDGDDDLDDARDDGDGDDDDIPPREEFSLGGICPPERSFLLCWFPPRNGGGTSDLRCPPPVLGFGGYVRGRRSQEPGPTTQAAHSAAKGERAI